MAEDGALGEIADVAVLVEGFLASLQCRLKLLPQQQVVSGLLHLYTPTGRVVTVQRVSKGV